MAGGVIGVGLAYGVVQFVTTTTLFSLPRLSEVSMSWPVLAFVLALTTATALSLGILIAWRGRRPGVVDWLKDAQRGNTGGRSLRRLRNTVVVTQLAVSLMLLVGAGLLGRSLSQLLDRNPGFRTDGVLAVQLSVPRPIMRFTQGAMAIDDPSSLPRQADFNRRAIERLAALPGVTTAGGINAFPLGARYSNGRFLVIRGDEPQTLQGLQQYVADPSRIGSANYRVASAGYFAAMGIPLVRGRLFESRDTADAPHVAVISESLARTRWPDSDPLGVRIQFGGMDGDLTPFTIVGIVGDIRERGLDTEPQPMFYADFRQRPLDTFDFNVVLHTSVEPATLIPAARRILAEMAPEMPPTFRTVREVLDGTTASRRLTLALTGFFAGAAMLLALLGVYGVLSYQVEQRRQEFGVRMALGARPADVRRLVMREAGWLVIVGLGVGVIGALASSRVLDSVLFGISSTDVFTYAGVMTVLGIAALVAAELPAMRATRLDPVEVLFEG
jgi:predicted permease